MPKPPHPALVAMAQEELAAARTLDWRELAKVTPWGDRFEGFLPDGRPAQIERSYVWKDQPGGDVLLEVTVYGDEIDYDAAARASAIISKR